MNIFQSAIAVIGLVVSFGCLLCSAIQCSLASHKKRNKNNKFTTENSESYTPENEPFSEFNKKDNSSLGDNFKE